MAGRLGNDRAMAAAAMRRFGAWIQGMVVCLASDDHGGLVTALSNEPKMGPAMWNVPFRVPPALSQTPVNLLELARILGAERCLRELSKRWSLRATSKVTQELKKSMEAFDAGDSDAERYMHAIWSGLRDSALANPRSPYFSAAICPRAPKANRSLLAYAAAHAFVGGDRVSVSAQKAYELLCPVELAIAKGDAAVLSKALDDLVEQFADDDTDKLGEATAASIMACAIGCDRAELAHMALDKVMRFARAPRRSWEVVLSVAKTVEPIFTAASSNAQAAFGEAFRSVFSAALEEDIAGAPLSLASERCHSELSALESCMLDGVAGARAAIGRSELLVATPDAVVAPSISTGTSSLRI